MRALRAVYRYARKRMDRTLPPDHPAAAVDFNKEKRRDTALVGKEWAKWAQQLAALPNPLRRELHMFTLLSGSRPDALKRARWEHLDKKQKTLFFPDPKGGEERAFHMPLSKPMLECLKRAREVGEKMHPRQAREWIFPADSPDGHLVEHKERRGPKKPGGSTRGVLFKWGGDLRQTYRTVAQEVGVGEVDVHLLLNHKLPGVSAGYITRGALLDHLREQQERISRRMLQRLKVNQQP
jgi:integrase